MGADHESDCDSHMYRFEVNSAVRNMICDQSLGVS